MHIPEARSVSYKTHDLITWSGSVEKVEISAQLLSDYSDKASEEGIEGYRFGWEAEYYLKPAGSCSDQCLP